MSQNSRIAEPASVFATRICSACRLYLRGCQKAVGSRQPGELVMLRRVVPPAGSAQWRPGGPALAARPPGRRCGLPRHVPLGCRPGISGYRADGTARRAPATSSPPA